MNHSSLSKFLSLVLRHRPETIGLVLDSQGWADIDALIEGAANHGQMFNRELIEYIVSSSDKKRFAISEDSLHIRAVQGHSAETVQRDFPEQVPPEILYHGTATRFLDSIKQQGLIAGSRHYVHLSSDQETALGVGQRYGKAILIRIPALSMHQQGFNFFLAENGVWLVRHVPADYLHYG